MGVRERKAAIVLLGRARAAGCAALARPRRWPCRLGTRIKSAALKTTHRPYPAAPTMPKASNPSPANEALALPTHYEAAMQELETVVARMESGDLPLDQLLTAYERGAALLQLCRDKLQAVENQIKVLDNGVLKPWKSA